jgi:acetyl-CoA carboxylase biotin carboxyl carrier protein
MELSLDTVRAVTRVLREAGLGEIVLESTTDSDKPCRLVVRQLPTAASARRARRQRPAGTAPSATTITASGETAQAGETVEAGPKLLTICATAVGHFRAAAPAIQTGDRVKAGQVIGFVESLKVPNEVTAREAGLVAEILTVEGQAVEYGQPLMTIEAAAPTETS